MGTDIRKGHLRLAGRMAVEEPPRNYEIEEVTRPGIVLGARLRAINKSSRHEIAVRTSLNREVGLLHRPDGSWRTIPKVQEVVVAVPSATDEGVIEVFGFDPKAMLEFFDAALAKTRRKFSYNAPVFIALDEIKNERRSGPISGGLERKAKWRTKFSLGSLIAVPDERQIGFVNRVKREFAELIGVDVKKIAVEFRIVD